MRGFAMTRSMLLSVTMIGAVLAVFAAASTFAAFTSSDSDSGSVTAGTVNITVEGTGAPGLVFTTGSAGCDLALAPGDICGPDTVTVTNNGPLAVTLGTPSADYTGGLSSCNPGPSSALSSTIDNLSYTPGVTVVAASGTQTFDITAELDAAADNACQGLSGTVTVTVEATST